MPTAAQHASWLCAALQRQVTTAFCQHSHTYASLPFMQFCSCPTVMHSRFAQDFKHASWLCAALQKQVKTALCQHSHTYASLLHSCSSKQRFQPKLYVHTFCQITWCAHRGTLSSGSLFRIANKENNTGERCTTGTAET